MEVDMYEGLVDGLKKKGESDSVHAASALAIEYQSAAAFVLLAVLAARLIHPLLGLVAFTATVALSYRGPLTYRVLKENDDRMETLLYYMVASLGFITLVVGWSAWM